MQVRSGSMASLQPHLLRVLGGFTYTRFLFIRCGVLRLALIAAMHLFHFLMLAGSLTYHRGRSWGLVPDNGAKQLNCRCLLSFGGDASLGHDSCGSGAHWFEPAPLCPGRCNPPNAALLVLLHKATTAGSLLPSQ